jgi:molecular chaperone GrpE
MSKEEVKSTQEKSDQEQTSTEEEQEISKAMEAQAGEETEAPDKKKSSKKKSIFSKGNKPKEQLEELQQEIGELKDKYIRLYAEFDNFRKRTSRERLDLMKTAGQDVVQDLLPVLDDIDRANEVVDKGGKLEDLKSGFDLIAHKLKKTLRPGVARSHYRSACTQ